MCWRVREKFSPQQAANSNACWSHWNDWRRDNYGGENALLLKDIHANNYYEVNWDLAYINDARDGKELLKVLPDLVKVFFSRWSKIWGEEHCNFEITKDHVRHWTNNGKDIKSFRHMFAIFGAFRVFGEHPAIGISFLHFARKYPRMNALQILFLAHGYRLEGHSKALPGGHEYIPDVQLSTGWYSLDYFKKGKEHAERISKIPAGYSPITTVIWPKNPEIEGKKIKVDFIKNFPGVLELR